jgi:glyoxylase-like metal-dependent hydrolase (beta-lactamase superfamily II)
VRPLGNVLVDSPRFTEALVGPIAALGGVHHIALTHRDDVADAHRWAERFSATTWIHAADHAAAPWATGVLIDEQELQLGFVAVPVPGHTKGSVVFLLDDRWLFTGDSLAWSHDHDDLIAFRGACWFSWKEQADSLAQLAERHRFAAILPGHGARHFGNDRDLHDRLEQLVTRMRR